jgi:hypothetical protein
MTCKLERGAGMTTVAAKKLEKVRGQLNEHLTAGRYYEAEQLYKTLQARYALGYTDQSPLIWFALPIFIHLICLLVCSYSMVMVNE